MTWIFLSLFILIDPLDCLSRGLTEVGTFVPYNYSQPAHFDEGMAAPAATCLPPRSLLCPLPPHSHSACR